MTGNCRALQTLADEPGYLQINSADARKYGIDDQQLVWISSRRGKVLVRAQVTDRANEGAVYMTYQWWVGACNELTADHFDPVSKTPEYKYTAARLESIKDQAAAETYLQTQYNAMREKLTNVVGN
jgi:formate dehydrogenase major subunit